MNTFAWFGESVAMTIKETKCYGQAVGWMDGHMDAQTHTRTDNLKTV